MKNREEILALEICECGEKSVAQAIEIFQETSLPFKKAKKLVTECNKWCCRAALLNLYDMYLFGRFEYEERAYRIEQRAERIRQLGQGV